MEGFEKKEVARDEVYSKSVRAGKRTYFFDVKSTKNKEFYLTITESIKHIDSDGRFNFEKHKIFLYKEDFDKFAEGLTNVLDYIKKHQPDSIRSFDNSNSEFTNVEFDDLPDSN